MPPFSPFGWPSTSGEDNPVNAAHTDPMNERMKLTTVWILLAVFGIAILVGIVSTLNSARSTGAFDADPTKAMNDVAAFSADNDYSIDYSLDGNYARFSLSLPEGTNGGMSMCVNTDVYPADCVTSYSQ